MAHLMIRNLIIAPDIREKLLNKHHVEEGEVHEAFMNRDGPYLLDEDEDHQTDPPSEYFLAETDRGRLLKVVFVFRDGNIYLKTAFDANAKSVHIYTVRRNKLES
jgi:hypothetical protein